MKFDLVIRNGNCLLTDLSVDSGYSVQKVDIGVIDTKISFIGIIKEKHKEEVDAEGLFVLPGLIDTQVHFRDPGLTHKEDIETGTKSAVLGGITGVFEMPNTAPNTTSPDDLIKKVDRAEEVSWANYAFYMGADKNNLDQLAKLEKLPACCGVKVFMGSSTGSLLVDDAESLEKVFQNTTRRVAFHCEDEKRLIERKSLLNDNPNVNMHPIWRDEQTALIATKQIIALSKKYNHLVHILHISSADEAKYLYQNKTDLTSIECTPQHLSLFAPECYDKSGSLAQMNPPIRDINHQNGLWEGMANHTFDILGSDHAPHTLEEKQNVYPNSPSGMPGVQTILPLMLNHVSNKKLSLERLTAMMSANPVKLFKLKNKGHIKEGLDADFTIVNMEKEKTIEQDWLEYKCGWSPFVGTKIKGWPEYTIINGHITMRDDKLISRPEPKAYEFDF